MTGLRREILDALRRAVPDSVSGEALAASLGVSRVAVQKHVAALREAGYEIAAEAGAGYRFESAPDAPTPAEVEPFLTSSFWSRLEGGGAVGSTNDEAKALAAGGAPEGTAFLAREQTAGKGRLGRTWASPPGGVYASAILRPAISPTIAAPLSLAVALGVAFGLEKLGLAPGLKWPNDVWLGSGKVAGVLLEMSAEFDKLDWVVAGFGINVRRPESGDAPGNAAYVADELPEARLAEVAAAVLDGIAEAYRLFLDEGVERVASEFERRSVLSGRAVTVRDVDGTELAAGNASRVDGSGRLVISGLGGEVAVSAGEVTLREGPRGDKEPPA